MKRCEHCSQEIHKTPDGYEFDHELPCKACQKCGARMKEKDGYQYCERWEHHK